MSEHTWTMPVAKMRVARVTQDLEAISRFYKDGLGLAMIASFEDHAGYSGLIFGLPGVEYQLEFTQEKDAPPPPKPHPDDLLVFYLREKEAIGKLVVRLGVMGYHPVAPANPYWENKSVTIPDPDGWRVVLVDLTAMGE